MSAAVKGTAAVAVLAVAWGALWLCYAVRALRDIEDVTGRIGAAPDEEERDEDRPPRPARIEIGGARGPWGDPCGSGPVVRNAK